MLRNYLAAALRNLVRNRLYAVINIIGLAIGFAAALLIALYVQKEFSFERSIPGRDDTYHVQGLYASPGSLSIHRDRVAPNLAALLKAASPAIQDVARLMTPTSSPQPILRHGSVESREDLYWADPNIFAVLPLPIFAGDPKTALSAPDAIVITRAAARKYFGREDVIGESIDLDRTMPMRVTAVLEDLPTETHLQFTALTSGLSSQSSQTIFETQLAGNARNYQVAYTYLRARPGTPRAELQRALETVTARPEIASTPPIVATYGLEPVTAIHLRVSNVDAMKPSTGRDALTALAAVGVLIVFIAGINFVNLMTARSMRRAVEVGVRKVSGAIRVDLVLQFIGEATVYALAGISLALLLTATLLPKFNAFVDRTIAFAFAPAQWIALLGVALTFGVLSGAYPAFILAGLAPARAVSGGKRQKGGSERGRRLLVAVQFAIFVGLVLAGGIIWQQTRFGMKQGLRLQTDQMLVVTSGGCVPAFRDAVLKLPGVRGAACSLGAPLGWFRGFSASRAGGNEVIMGEGMGDFGLLQLYGLKPVAGRFLDPAVSADAVPLDEANFTKHIVINERAARELGFDSPGAAVGQTIRWHDLPAEVVGIAPDFRLAEENVRNAAPGVAYPVSPDLIQRYRDNSQLHIKLSGRDLPETLEAIDSLWRSLGSPRPISRYFVDARVQASYADIVRQAQIFGIFAGMALLVACLGLFGLSAFAAEERTKEIGIRKAMGATVGEIIRMLLWQFAKPVLSANAIAWPVAYFIMRHWLYGFAYHIDLQPWIFVVASAAALVIATLTVLGHALLVARSQPATALRYE